MQRQPDRVAVAQCVDLGLVARLAGKGVVGRHGAVVRQPQHLAAQVVRILCALAASAAGRHVEHAVAAEGNARRAAGALGDEEVLHRRQRLAVPRAARQRQRALIGSERLRVGEVDVAVLGKARVQRDVHQAREALRPHHRYPGHGRRVQHAIADHAQLSASLGHQHVATGQEGEAPWMRQAARHDHDADLLALGRVERDRPAGSGSCGIPCGATGMLLRKGTVCCARADTTAATTANGSTAMTTGRSGWITT